MVFPSDTTHLQHWVFTEKELARQRHRVYQETVERISAQFEQKGVTFTPSIILPIEECEFLVCYFAAQLFLVCNEKKMDYRVTNTALVFLRRFYLNKTILEHDPRHILLACLFLAIKVEELSTQISLRTFADGLISANGIRLSDVIDNELVVLDVLKFQILILHPRTPLHYLTTEYFQKLKPAKAPPTSPPEEQQASLEQQSAFGHKVAELNREAEALATLTLTNSDLPFIFTPSQLAMGCFIHLARLNGLPDADAFLKNLFETHGSNEINSAAAASPRFYQEYLQPTLEDLKSRLLVLREQQQLETDEEKAERALKAIKKVDKMKRLLQKQGNGSRKEKVKKQKKEETPATSPSAEITKIEEGAA